MSDIRKRFTSQNKAMVAIEAIKEERTIAELSSHFGVHGTQVSAWKKQAIETINQGFADKRQRDDLDKDQLIEELYKQVGQLRVENEWLKKKAKTFR